jgi:hypothetical protein
VFTGNDTNLSLTNSTLFGNTAGEGGGVWNGNDAILNLARTLISGNTATSGAEVFNNAGLVTAASFNLFGHRRLTNGQAFENFTPGATDITATSNGNNPTRLNRILNTNLADNGGPTQTHALVRGSPAIDTVTAGICPPPGRDQRGVRKTPEWR